MLKWMRLKNLALVEEADMEFGPGFNVISGETGAGKSVIMGGVSLLLGGRADKSSIRIGADRCEISGEFELGNDSSEKIAGILSAAGIDGWQDAGRKSILIRRTITQSSGRNFINESPVTLQVLKDIGDELVDIHAANEHHRLVRNNEQLAILDRFCHLENIIAEVASAWSRLDKLRKDQAEFLNSMPSGEEAVRLRRELLEIEKAAPQKDEDSELSAKHALASHSRAIIEASVKAAGMLSESENSITDRIGEVRRILFDMEKVDPENSAAFISRCEEISAMTADLASDLSTHAADVETDESEFAAMEERLRVLQTLKRRYGPTLDDVSAYLEKIRAELYAFDNAELTREKFKKDEAELKKVHEELCNKLSGARQKGALKLSKDVCAEARKLGFKKADFAVEFEKIQPGPNGFDKVEFMFTANPGVPLMPLKEVASSGEISRVMLALKTVLAEADSIPVLIFDEIDANIGGETAAKVGQEIAKLAGNKQILCISHLPQVAHKAEVHFMVSKESRGNTTSTTISRLEHYGRISEIARMLGGGKAALEHAEAMMRAE